MNQITNLDNMINKIKIALDYIKDLDPLKDLEIPQKIKIQ